MVDVHRLQNQLASEPGQIASTSTSASSPEAWSIAPYGLLRCPGKWTVGAVQYTFFSLGGMILLIITLASDVESNPGPPTNYMCLICSQRINNNKKYKGSVLCISCKDWVHTTCTTLTNTKQYTNAWTCSKCNTQDTPPVTTPLVFSTTNITPFTPIITPHPTMHDDSTPNRPGSLMSLYGPTFHGTPVDLCISNVTYIYGVMSWGNKIVSNILNDPHSPQQQHKTERNGAPRHTHTHIYIYIYI